MPTPNVYPQIVDIPLDSFVDSEDSEKSEIRRLRSENALWRIKQANWHFYLTAYQGGEEFVTKNNIFRHFRENPQDYEDRLQRAHNMNYCESIVDFFTNFIYSESIDREGGPTSKAFFDDFIGNVNARGEDIDTVMRDVCDSMQVFGMVYVLVDSPPLPEQVDADGNLRPLTKQDLIDAKWRPYWVIIKPEEIIQWVCNEAQSLVYAKRKQVVDSIDAGGVNAQLERYSEFYPNYTQVTDIDITETLKPKIVARKVFPNQLGFIPMGIARYKKDKLNAHMGLSFIRDFAYNQREIMNLTSVLQEFLYRQAFNVLAMETDSNIGIGNSQGTDTVTPTNVIEYPKGGKAPVYVSPPVAPAEFISAERQRIKNEMFLRAAQDAINELFNGEKASGFSQAQSFFKTMPFISSRASILEALENELMTITCKMVGITWDGKVRYKDRYEITNLTDALQQFIVIMKDLQLPSPTFAKEELKRMVREFDGKLPIETLNAVYSEIDKADFGAWQETMKTALIGSPGGSPKANDQETMSITEHAAEGRVKVTDSTKSKV